MKRFAAIAFLVLGFTAARAHAQESEAPHAEAAETHDVPAGAEPEAAHEADPSRGFNFTDLHYTGSPFGEGEHAPAHAGAEGEHAGTPAPFLYLVLNFVLLLVILAWKAGPAARKAAEKRSDEIKKALDEAARLRNEAKAKLDEYQTKLAAAEKEIAAMVEGMRADAEADKKRIIAAAEAQAIALKKDADERINAEILRARALLSREVAHAATVAAEALIRDKATAADQSHMVDAFITDVAASKPLAKETI
jgi:F0F1-type ATP synthase membrane subunit b/b'